jgi:hypothetical protein
MKTANLKERLARVATKVTQKFRKGNHELGLVGVAGGGVMSAIGVSGMLGGPTHDMIQTLTNNVNVANQYATYANDFATLLGVTAAVLGLNEYRKWRLRKQIMNE